MAKRPLLARANSTFGFRQGLLKRAPPTATDTKEPTKGPLTARELDVLRAAARGLTNAEIRAELYQTLSTVKPWLQIGGRKRVKSAAWSWRSGLVDD